MNVLSWRAQARIYHPRGVSLIISIIFVSFFMLLSAGMAESILAGIRSRGNRAMAGKALYLVKTAEELALLAASEHGVGWNSTPDDVAAYEAYLWGAARDLGVETCGAAVAGTKKEPCAGFSVVGRAAPEARVKLLGEKYYSVPAAMVDGEGAAAVVVGTGDAAEACNPTQYPVSGGDNANDPCHWNKLKVGQTVEIPLYNDEDSSPTLNEFKLRIRMPDGIELYPPVSDAEGAPYRDIKRDPVLVPWSITGTSTGEVSKTLIAADVKFQQNDKFRSLSLADNTEISGGRLNESASNGGSLSNFEVLLQTHEGLPATEQLSTGISQFLATVEHPLLRLTLANQPHRNTVDQVPYNPADDADNPAYRIPFLEYQLLVKCPLGVDTCSPADSRNILSGWVEIGNFRKEFLKYRSKEPSLGGFVLENF